MKDGRGFWVGDYWGVISFGVNRAVVSNVPRTWADLLKSEYRNRVALNGSPLSSGSAVAGVFSASIANGGSLSEHRAGHRLLRSGSRDAGNFIPVQATPQTIASGQTPIMIDWDYLNLAYVKEFPARQDRGRRPHRDGVYGAYYCQAINATAPHPWAARLWQEFLYSDAGPAALAEGASRTRRCFTDMSRRKVVPKELLDRAAAAAVYEQVKFASGRAAHSGPGEDRRRVAGEGRHVGRWPRTSEQRRRRRPARTGRRRRLPLSWIVVLPFFALRLRLPVPAGGQGALRRVPVDGRRLHARQRRRSSSRSRTGRRSRTSIEVSLVTALLGGAARLPDRLRDDPGGHTALDPAQRLTTFSGVAANFAGIPLAFAFIATLGTIGIVTQFLDQPRLEPVRARVHALLEDRGRARLPLLPDPADDPRHRARDRRAQARVAGGGVEPRRDAAAVLASRRHARSCCRRSSARWCCCSAIRSPPTRPPTG